MMIDKFPSPYYQYHSPMILDDNQDLNSNNDDQGSKELQNDDHYK